MKKTHPKIQTELVLKEGLPWWGVHLHKNVKGGLNKKNCKKRVVSCLGFHCIALYCVVFCCVSTEHHHWLDNRTVFDVARVHVYSTVFCFCVVSLFYSVVLCFVVRCIPIVCCVSPKHTQRLPTEQFQMYIALYFLHWNYSYVVWYYTFPCHDPAKHCHLVVTQHLKKYCIHCVTVISCVVLQQWSGHKTVFNACSLAFLAPNYCIHCVLLYLLVSYCSKTDFNECSLAFLAPNYCIHCVLL